jgi:hypothetical protein
MMRLLITHDAPGPQWQLGSPSTTSGAFALIGWSPDEQDGGVPERIVDVLARSFASFGRVTFACSTISTTDAPGWQMQGDEFVARYQTRSALGRMAARLSARAPVDLTLLSTTSEQSMRRLFDDPGYPWWNQGQFVLVSAVGAPAPDFDRIAFNPADLFGRDRSESFGLLRPLGVQAMLCPGVDGDVAGLLCASTGIRDRFETILSHDAQELGVSLQHVSEAEFSERLAAPPAQG